MGALKTVKHQAIKLFYVAAYLTFVILGQVVDQVKYYGEVYLGIGFMIATGFIVQLPEESRSGAGGALFIIVNLLAIPYIFIEGSILNSAVRGLQEAR
jgi:hypothetical protein